MRAIIPGVVAVLAASAFGANPTVDRVQEQFQSENYTVKWGTPRTFDAGAELEIGTGVGHAFRLGWLRFRPAKGRIDVLSVNLDERLRQFRSKWPPDRPIVTVTLAQMTCDAFAAFLRDLARIDSAQVRSVEWSFEDPLMMSSANFWYDVRLTANNATLVDLDWAGYWGNRNEYEYAKARAAVTLANLAVRGLEFKAHTLTSEECRWASAKFARDWKKFKDSTSHWWVREGYIIAIGFIGGASALPTLLDPLQGGPKDRCVYYAINAITRLTNKDVRDKPVEEMDVERTRRRVLQMLGEGK